MPKPLGIGPGPVVDFQWHGGEPTLAGIGFYRRVAELQERYLPDGWTARNNLQTNGTLLDDAWCAFLAGHRFSVGISIDGPAWLHDAGRPDRSGHPSHERVIAGFHRLRAHGIDPDVLCTLNSLTAAHPAEVYRYFLGLGVGWLQFLPVVNRDRTGRPDPWSVTPEAMGDFLCAVFDEWVRRDVARIGVQNFLECLLVVCGGQANLCLMAPACGRTLAMEHDGTVYSCDHYVDPEHRLGDVAASGFGPLLLSGAQIAFGAAKQDLPDACLACDVRFLCNGGCPKDRVRPGEADEPGLNYLCGGYRHFYGHMLPALRRMGELIRAGQSPAAIMDELA